MRWFRVDKSKTAQPSTGSYRDWKEILRSEGRKQCVYCAISEPHFGGFRNFHVEHYRPKSSFPELRNIIANLFYCCAICNSFKGDNWPGDPGTELENHCFPDPSVVDYSSFVSINAEFAAQGSNLAAKYLIERLYLNRPQLLLLRRLVAAKLKLREIIYKSKAEFPDLGKIPGMAELMADVALFALDADQVAHYEPADIKRMKPQ